MGVTALKLVTGGPALRGCGIASANDGCIWTSGLRLLDDVLSVVGVITGLVLVVRRSGEVGGTEPSTCVPDS